MKAVKLHLEGCERRPCRNRKRRAAGGERLREGTPPIITFQAARRSAVDVELNHAGGKDFMGLKKPQEAATYANPTH